MGLQEKGWHWGDIRGLIRITGTESIEEFGFGTKPGAEGIMFRRYPYVTSGGKHKIGIFINNYMPRVQPHTPAQVACWNIFGILSHLVCTNRDTFYPIWQPLAEFRHYYKAMWTAEFRGINMKLVGTPPTWMNMLISDGTLEPVFEVTGVSYLPNNCLRITFNPATYQNGRSDDTVHAAIFDEALQIFEIPQDTKTWKRQDQEYRGITTVAFNLPNSIVYIYFSRNTLHSPSVSLHGT